MNIEFLNYRTAWW